MKLDARDLAVLHDRRERLPMLRHRHRIVCHRRDVAVREVDLCLIGDVIDDRRVAAADGEQPQRVGGGATEGVQERG